MRNIFHISLLEQNISRKEQVKKIQKLYISNKDSKKYRLKIKQHNLYKEIRKSSTKALLSDKMKNLSRKKKHLRASFSGTSPQKIDRLFYKNYLKKPITTSQLN